MMYGSLLARAWRFAWDPFYGDSLPIFGTGPFVDSFARRNGDGNGDSLAGSNGYRNGYGGSLRSVHCDPRRGSIRGHHSGDRLRASTPGRNLRNRDA